MNYFETQDYFSPEILWILILVAIVSLILKGIALWRSARREQKGWFIALLIFNTVGLLPIVYLVFFGKEETGKKKKK